MSFFGKLAKQVLGTVAPYVPGGQLISAGLALSGSPGGVNIANKLSKQVGCTIAQKDANQARALMAKGIDPCTGQSKTPVVTQVPTARTVTAPYIIPQPGTMFGSDIPRPTYKRPSGLPEGYPQIPLEILKKPVPSAQPTVEVPPMSAMFAAPVASMAAIGPVAAMAGRVLTAATKRKIIRLVKAVGIHTAATVLGLELTQVAEVVANPPRRRRRGITAAQLSNAKRVNNAVIRMANDLQCGCAPRRRTTTRRKTCR